MKEIEASEANPAKRLKGNERFHLDGKKHPLPKASVIDFWSWAYSDILNNTTRGVLAEYLVAQALRLDISTSIRQGWDAYDLSYGATKIEVKSTAYVQVWNEEKKSTPQFNISSRKCDVYVFCLLAEENKREADPLNLSQWQFCVVGIDTIKEKLDKGKEKPQETIRKAPIEKKLGGNWIDYRELEGAIEQCAK